MRSSEKSFVFDQGECSALAHNIRPISDNSLQGNYPQCKMSREKASTLWLIFHQRKRNSVRRCTGWAMGKALSIISSEFSQQHTVKNSSYIHPIQPSTFSEPLKWISSVFFGKIHRPIRFSYEVVNKRSHGAIAWNQPYSLSMYGLKYN